MRCLLFKTLFTCLESESFLVTWRFRHLQLRCVAFHKQTVHDEHKRATTDKKDLKDTV